MSADEARRKPLGRGLSALLGEAASEPVATGRGVRSLPVGEIRPNRYQPRRDFAEAEMAELVRSVKERGVLQPILVRRCPDQPGYELIAGERRWRAAQAAKLHEIPVVIRDLSDREALELALVENVQRSDLNPIDEALAYSRLMKEFGHTQEAVAEALGKSRSHIANLTRLLDLPQGVIALVAKGELGAGHARALLGSPKAAELAQVIVARGMSVREVERWMRTLKEGRKGAKAKPPPAKDSDTRALERELSERLGLKVAIDHARGGQSGSVTIQYQTLDQLDDLLARLGRGR